MSVLQFRMSAPDATRDQPERRQGIVIPYPLERYEGLIERLVRQVTALDESERQQAVMLGIITAEYDRLSELGVQENILSATIISFAKSIAEALRPKDGTVA